MVDLADGSRPEFVRPGAEIRTLAAGKPNWVVDLTSEGILVHTERSKAAGEPDLVEGWMFQVAWDHLVEHGELANAYLVSSDGLNVKRSSAVCAVLAHLPEVEVVSTSPIVLRLRRRSTRPRWIDRLLNRRS